MSLSLTMKNTYKGSEKKTLFTHNYYGDHLQNYSGLEKLNKYKFSNCHHFCIEIEHLLEDEIIFKIEHLHEDYCETSTGEKRCAVEIK